jgi:hypothetical protein
MREKDWKQTVLDDLEALAAEQEKRLAGLPADGFAHDVAQDVLDGLRRDVTGAKGQVDDRGPAGNST